jgi:serine/threonine protein kinase
LKLTPRGKIKLLDFGIAKGGAEAPNSTTINNQTFVAATLNYSPLEQIFRVLDPVFREVLTQRFEERIKIVMQQNADARSDLYALGATAYHLLTGFLPIDSLKRTIEVWSNKPDPLDHPTKLNSKIPPEISNVLLKAMELDYNRRYTSAIEMQQALNQALAEVKTREANQAQNTLEMSSQPGWQQQTRLPSEQSYTDAATQQIPLDKLPKNYQQGISEETIQSGALGYQQGGFGQNTGGAPPPPTPNSPFNTGGQPPFNTGGQQQQQTGGQYQNQTGGNVQPTEMVNFAGVSTGGSVPPPNFPNNQFSTGGAMNSNNPLSPGVGFAPNYGVQEQKKSSKIWWVLPILLLLFIGVAGAGGGFYLWYQANSGTTENITPTPTATTSPSATVSASKTPSPSPSPTENVGAKDETTKPTVQPTATKPVVTNTPVRTPPPVIKTPKPNTPKKNSDCIFSGDC